MLKAYDYIEYDHAVDKRLHDTRIFNEEKRIAERVVRDLLQNKPVKEKTGSCPVCGNADVNIFFDIWSVEYYRCESCFSIFTNADPDVLEAYKKSNELIEFRLSDQYQSAAEERRDIVWEDMIDWVKFRSYRYLGRNKNLNVIDYGNRFKALVNRLITSSLVDRYELRDSIIPNIEVCAKPLGSEKADIVLYLNRIQQSINPVQDLQALHEIMKEDGLLFLSTRVGTGFDILTLQKNITNVFPYEHVLLLSKEGLEIALSKAGFKVLEISTPGLLDLQYVLDNREGIEKNNLFIKYLIDTADKYTLSEFQRFLQKSGLSSYAQVIATREM
ncbi:MAG: hypothetical protein BAA01_10265 [Bacillus thermozeamaize]|uniref:Uncharacterized protein n=1 Tax=Bacillus thermozeamaize TaxID=230954 RepID=A0A1Y3PNQ5_9BACI|nr:MAG: hypothetical protein BAA01_10265 [Bacillus thermozeamaize]